MTLDILLSSVSYVHNRDQKVLVDVDRLIAREMPSSSYEDHSINKDTGSVNSCESP